MPRRLSSIEKQEIDQLLSQQGKIAAIKYVRNRFHLSLHEAKELIDGWHAGNNDRALLIPRRSIDRNSRRLWFRLGVVLFLMIGGVFLTISYWIWTNHDALVARSERLNGTVIRLESTESGAVPVVEFNWQGEPRTWRSHISSRPPAYSPGDSVTMVVDPEDPSQALIDDFLHRWLLVTIFGSIGAAFSLAALITALVAMSLRTSDKLSESTRFGSDL